MIAILIASSMLAQAAPAPANTAQDKDIVQFQAQDGSITECIKAPHPGPNDLAWSCESSPFVGQDTYEPGRPTRDTNREIRLLRPVGALFPQPRD
jgi:hypothetical protein